MIHSLGSQMKTFESKNSKQASPARSIEEANKPQDPPKPAQNLSEDSQWKDAHARKILR